MGMKVHFQTDMLALSPPPMRYLSDIDTSSPRLRSVQRAGRGAGLAPGRGQASRKRDTKFQMTALASMSWVVPPSSGPRYGVPPGQLWPPPLTW